MLMQKDIRYVFDTQWHLFDGVGQVNSWADREVGQGVRTPPPEKKNPKIGFLSNTGPDPLK